MTKYAVKLYDYLNSLGRVEFTLDDCFNVPGITRTNVDGILDELSRHGKVYLDNTVIPPDMRVVS